MIFKSTYQLSTHWLVEEYVKKGLGIGVVVNNKSSYKTIESCGFSFDKYFEDEKKEKYKVYKLEKKYS